MDYYKQGDPANADKIKAAFEKLGYDISWPGGCANPDVINIGVERNGAKYVIAETAEYIKDIIKTHPDYKELELTSEPMFKDGDVLVTTKIRSCPFIYRKTDYNNNLAYYYVGIDGNGNLSIGWPKRTLCHFGLIADAVIAGQGQRDLLFAKMKKAGYQWDADKKELRKIQPHYDVANFHAGMPVLVRDGDGEEWNYLLFSHYRKKLSDHFFAGGNPWFQCIPFNDDTKHLLGTTDMPSEEYINW